MNKIQAIYKKIYRKFGPQKWWPTTLEHDIHPTYHGKKINEKQRFEIVVVHIDPKEMYWHGGDNKYMHVVTGDAVEIDPGKGKNK